VLPLAVEADKLQAAAKKAKRQLTAAEQEKVDKVNAIVNELVQVDVFDKLGKEKYEGPDYVRPALRHTKFANMNGNQASYQPDMNVMSKGAAKATAFK